MGGAFGQIDTPQAIYKFGTVDGGAIGNLLNLAFRLMIVVGGIYALFNFILAGYGFLSAGDDPKAIAGAWAKIWQSVVGLVLMAGAFVLAAIFGLLIFGDAGFILNPVIPGVQP